MRTGDEDGLPEARMRALELEVARLSHVEHQMEQLLAVTGELAAARSHDDVSRIAIDQGIAAVGASHGGLWLLEPDGATLRLLGASRLPRGDLGRWQTIPLATDAPLAQVVRTGEPIYLLSLAEYEARFPASLARIRSTISLPDPAYVNLPLVASAGPVGGLALTFERAADLDASERTFLAILARQCGLAIERIQRYEAERLLRLEAEQAMHAREEILSMMSHDLRNPLGTILMGASTLLAAADPTAANGERIRSAADRIQRQAERMTGLIEDLVDFADIQSGGLALRRRPHPPSAILARVAERHAPFAAERGLAFEVTTPPAVAAALPPVECDLDRAVQVFASLIANAVKVTPKNGRLSIGVNRDDDHGMTWFVRDTGPGIAADELPSLFERYWRSKHAVYRGAGLRLSIARGIVEAHGGRIWADSQPGSGATFYFTLPQGAPAQT